MEKRRVPGTEYTEVATRLANDSTISFRARGIYLAIMAKPDSWRPSVANMTREGPEGEKAIQRALRELVDHGYITRRQYLDEKRRFDAEFVIYDVPVARNEQ